MRRANYAAALQERTFMQQDGGAASTSRNQLEIPVELGQEFLGKAMDYLPSVAGALFVLGFGLWAAGIIKGAVSRAMARTGRIDDTLRTFLASLIHYGLIGLVIISALGLFGVPTTSFAAVIGAAGLAIGLALQGTLGHVASGVMMLGFRPFDVGDFVETAGKSGTVKAIGLFTTELATTDNKKIIIPNGKIFDDVIVNYAGYDTRRVDLVFGVSYGDDLNKAIALIEEETKRLDTVKDDPAPVIAVDALGDSSVNIICRVWVDRPDFFVVKWALTKSIKERFDAEDVTIPFPTRTIYNESTA